MRFIRLDENNKVIATRLAESIVEGEIQSDIGEIGQIMQSDGTFIDPPIEPVTPSTTIEERLINIEDTQDLILLKLEGVI